MKQVKPSEIGGEVRAPPSKSLMQRAVAAAALSAGESSIGNPSFCDDALAALSCAKALGASVRRKGEKVLIIGGGKPKGSKLNCGESGLCMRMFTPIAALFDRKIALAGKGSLAKRRMDMAVAPLGKLGAECKTNRGFLPIAVHGPIHGGAVSVDGSQSSQFVSGLLMALPLCKGDSIVTVANLKSRPYVMMTLELMGEFGVAVGRGRGLDRFEIAGEQSYKPAKYEVEGDWSAAAFLLVAGAIAGKVKVAGLRLDSLQADRAMLDALKKAGAAVRIGSGTVAVEGGRLSAFDFDATDYPDLFPPLVALACFCSGESAIKGASRLLGKESDRASVLALEFSKLGAMIEVRGDDVLVTGAALEGGTVDSHGDHRIAMACSIAALRCKKPVKITNEECVSKSYPGFFEDLESLMVK